MIKRVVSKWKSYRYRFVPWLAWNFRERTVRSVPDRDQDRILPTDNVVNSLQLLFQSFHDEVQCAQSKDSAQVNSEIVLRQCGFSLERCPSSIHNGGSGVVVKEGIVATGKVVALYPGTVYQPYEPVFFQSIRNPFIFRCIDNVYIDGNDKNLSKLMYRSCAHRDRHGPHFTCDMSWLTPLPVNPLNIGQYVNNQSKTHPANVCYQEVDLPRDFPFHLLQYIPNIHYSPSCHGNENRCLRMVVLVSTRDILAGEELFSTYFTVIHC